MIIFKLHYYMFILFELNSRTTNALPAIGTVLALPKLYVNGIHPHLFFDELNVVKNSYIPWKKVKERHTMCNKLQRCAINYNDVQNSWKIIYIQFTYKSSLIRKILARYEVYLNRKPLMRLLFGHEFSVMLVYDGGRVACLQRRPSNVASLGDPVADERMPETVVG